MIVWWGGGSTSIGKKAFSSLYLGAERGEVRLQGVSSRHADPRLNRAKWKDIKTVGKEFKRIGPYWEQKLGRNGEPVGAR